MSRLPQILFLCEFWAETASEKEAVPCQNSSWNEKWYIPGREGLNTIIACTGYGDFGGQEPMCAYSTYTSGRAKIRSGPGGSIVTVVAVYKSLLRKDLTRRYRADPAVRRPHEYAQSPVAESRMLSASSDQGQRCCHFPSLLVGEESSESRPLILLMGKKPPKSFKEKCFTF